MSTIMINLYVNLIKLGVKTINDVPLSIRMAVETKLAEEGFIV